MRRSVVLAGEGEAQAGRLLDRVMVQEQQKDRRDGGVLGEQKGHTNMRMKSLQAAAAGAPLTALIQERRHLFLWPCSLIATRRSRSNIRYSSEVINSVKEATHSWGCQDTGALLQLLAARKAHGGWCRRSRSGPNVDSNRA